MLASVDRSNEPKRVFSPDQRNEFAADNRFTPPRINPSADVANPPYRKYIAAARRAIPATILKTPREGGLWRTRQISEPLLLAKTHRRDLVAAADHGLPAFVYQYKLSLFDLMLAFRAGLSGLCIDRDQIVFVRDQNRVRVGKHKIGQPFVRTFVTPNRLARFRIDRRDAERAFFLRFAVLEPCELAAGANIQNVADTRHLGTDAEIVGFPIHFSCAAIDRTNASSAGDINVRFVKDRDRPRSGRGRLR